MAEAQRVALSRIRHFCRIPSLHIHILLVCGCLSLCVLPLLASDAAAQLFGDTDGDRDGDLDDLNNVRNHFGECCGLPGDINGSGIVDIDDVNNVRQALFRGTPVVGPAPASGAAIRLDPVVSFVGLVDDPMAMVDWQRDAAGWPVVAPGQGDVFANVDLRMSISDVGRAEAVGFGNVRFDVNLAGDLHEGFGHRTVGWVRTDSTVDHDGKSETPEVPLFADVLDATERFDLLDVLVGTAPRDFGPTGVDLRRMMGQTEAITIGSVVVTFDTDVVSTYGTVEAVVKSFSTYDENLLLGRNDGEMAGGQIPIRVGLTVCSLGDTDCDGIVDIDDLNNVRNNFGAVGPANGTLPGDTFPYDGMVNIDDLNDVRNHFFSALAEATIVPEAASICLLILSLGVAQSGRRQRKSPR